MYGRIRIRRRTARTIFITGLMGLVLLTGASAAQAALTAVGPIDPNTGFPTYFQDSQNTRLALCLDPTGGLCLASVPGTPSVPGNFPADGEAFWFNASTTIDSGGVSARLVQAVEAAFANGDVVDGEQIGFARIRIRIDGLNSNASYTVTYPYGKTTFTTDGVGSINFTSDVGCFDTPNCDFSRVLSGAVGPFLRWDPAFGPAPPAGYIGDPNVDHRVVGSPLGTNFFRIEGPGLPAAGLRTDVFSVQGKIAPNAPPPPPPAPTAVVSPTSVAFPDTTVGQTSAPRPVTLFNGGNATLNISDIALVNAGSNFSISSNSCGPTLAPSASCTVNVTFSPAAAGGAAATLRFTDNAANSPQSVALSGTGVAAPPPPPPPGTPGAVVSPTTLAFADTTVGQSTASKPVTLTNNGDATLNISGVALVNNTPSNFTIASGCGAQLTAGSSCTVNVTFSPASAGAKTATLRFTDNAATSPQTVTLNGTGITGPPPPPQTPGAALSTTTLAFADTTLGDATPPKPVTLTNNGTAPLTISDISIVGADPNYSISSNTCPATLAVGASCQVAVVFNPHATGPHPATLRFTDNAPSGTQNVALSGTGLPVNPPPPPPAGQPGVGLNPPFLDFGNQSVLLSILLPPNRRPLTITNTGDAALIISGMSISGPQARDFSIESTDCVGASIAPGATCTVNMAFRAGLLGLGSRNGTLTIATNAPAPAGVVSVPLFGNGTLL